MMADDEDSDFVELENEDEDDEDEDKDKKSKLVKKAKKVPTLKEVSKHILKKGMK